MCSRLRNIKWTTDFQIDIMPLTKGILMRNCVECGEYKEKEDFHLNRCRKEGVVEVCKPCNRVRFRESYQRNKDKKHARDAKRRATKLEVCPPWADEHQIYLHYKYAIELSQATGEKFVVHHDIPLKEFKYLFRGLHIAENLSIVTEEVHRELHKELRERYGEKNKMERDKREKRKSGD